MRKYEITIIALRLHFCLNLKDAAAAKNQLKDNIDRIRQVCRLLIRLGYLMLALRLYFICFQ